MAKKVTVNKKLIKSAVEIYYRLAFDYKVDDREIEMTVCSILRQLEESGFAEYRAGMLGWTHAKIYVSPQRGLRVYTNDTNTGRKNEQSNKKRKTKIEKSWQEAGIPIQQ